MKRSLMALTACCALVFGVVYGRTHRNVPLADVPLVPAASTDQPAPPPEISYSEAREAQQMVTITGPLADYLLNHKQEQGETVRFVSHHATPIDHQYVAAAESPVGTSNPILKKTFEVAAAVNLPFELPAHASTPQLHGTYRSFFPANSGQSSDAEANVEFSLFNEKQYADFMSGHPAEAMLSADGAHDQEVNFSLPPTFGEPAKYYLVFNNSSRHEGKKLVHADFRVDF